MLQMVVIDLSPQDDPNLIFETLNARGTPLEQSDLIKNFVLSLERDPQSDIWGNLGRRMVGGRMVRQGRLFRPRCGHARSTTGWRCARVWQVSPTRVFARVSQLRRWPRGPCRRCPWSSMDLVNYHDFESTRGRSPEEQSFYYHVDVMQARVITPVLLLLLSTEAETCIRAFNALESFLVRRMILPPDHEGLQQAGLGAGQPVAGRWTGQGRRSYRRIPE